MRPDRPMPHGGFGGTQALGLSGDPLLAYVWSLLLLVPISGGLPAARAHHLPWWSGADHPC